MSEEKEKKSLPEVEIPGKMGMVLGLLKNVIKNPTIYSILAILSLLATFYMDYRASVSRLEDIGTKAQAIDTSRVSVDQNLQQNIKEVLDYSIKLENRMSTLEEKVRHLEEENTSLLFLLIGGERKPEPVAGKHGDIKASSKVQVKQHAPELKFEEPKPVFVD